MENFKDLGIGQPFMLNGAHWTKTSTKTARLSENNRVFYFSKFDVVTINF